VVTWWSGDAAASRSRELGSRAPGALISIWRSSPTSHRQWLLERDALRRGLDATTRLGPLLTDDRRAVVLAIKEAAVANDRRVSGLAVCRAVVYDDVGSLEEFDRWRLRREGSRS